MQLRQWRPAADDLGRAVELYGTKVPPALLSSLGVARGQCDEWVGAAEAFDQVRLAFFRYRASFMSVCIVSTKRLESSQGTATHDPRRAI